MDGSFDMLGGPPGDGGDGAPSDESTTAGSILTNKNNQYRAISVEVSSPFPVNDDDDDENLELGLGLSIRGGGGGGGSGGGYGGLKSQPTLPSWDQYARILTAKDFPNSSSSSAKNADLSTFDTKRIASDSPPSVIGWPPIRRGLRLANQTKLQDEQSSSTPEPHKTMKNNVGSNTKVVINNGYLPVKVNMDGTLIGRKVDLNAHSSYATLAQTVEDMFCEKRSSTEAGGPSKLLDATSEFVLTYEDKDGDCMLVGDVPWQMFLSSVKRLRIMRNSESNKLGAHKRTIASPLCQEKNTRRRTDGI